MCEAFSGGFNDPWQYTNAIFRRKLQLSHNVQFFHITENFAMDKYDIRYVPKSQELLVSIYFTPIPQYKYMVVFDE